MPTTRAKIGAQWMSPNDIRSALTRIQSASNRHAHLIGNLRGRLERRGQEVERSLSSLDQRDRTSVLNKSRNGYRAELVRESADVRKAQTRELAAIAAGVRSAATHYRSPMQMLMRSTLGSERRSRIMQQIANSGPVELASLAEYAAAQRDEELAAALCSRVAEMPRADRPFSAAELADVIHGDLHRELSQALVEVERRVLEGLQIDTEFETGKPNAQRTLEIAILKKREREIGAYGFEDEDEEPIEPQADQVEEIVE